jgi:ABC-type transport system involved in multi-copper enzyme maturation permease subunit
MLPAYINAFSLGVNAFERVSKDFGLTLITYFGIGMAILLASSSVPRDLENRSLYPILARPVRRSQYILAHFLSLGALLAASLLFLGFCMSLAISAMTRTVDLTPFIAVFASYLQCCVVAAVCLTVSTVASPALAGTVGAFVFLVGSLPGAFVRFFLVEDRENQVAATMATVFKSLLPNLSVLSIKDPVVHSLQLNPAYLGGVFVYALLWIALLLSVASVLFGRRDL